MCVCVCVFVCVSSPRAHWRLLSKLLLSVSLSKIMTLNCLIQYLATMIRHIQFLQNSPYVFTWPLLKIRARFEKFCFDELVDSRFRYLLFVVSMCNTLCLLDGTRSITKVAENPTFVLTSWISLECTAKFCHPLLDSFLFTIQFPGNSCDMHSMLQVKRDLVYIKTHLQ